MDLFDLFKNSKNEEQDIDTDNTAIKGFSKEDTDFLCIPYLSIPREKLVEKFNRMIVKIEQQIGSKMPGLYHDWLHLFGLCYK